ncbi:MAG: hypothetical protein ABJZ55_15295 [Fuerstiella sp.]
MPDRSYLDVNVYVASKRLDAPLGFKKALKKPLPPLPPKPPSLAPKKPVWPPPKKAVKKSVDTSTVAYRGLFHSYLQNYQEVLSDRVYRSAAPCYELDGHDAVQFVRPETIAYLKAHRFRNIVSLNERPVHPESRKQLTKAGILHKHLPVRDFKPLSMKQMELGIAITNSGKTLIHCGYGQGRTGTMVGAWYVHYTHTRNSNYLAEYSVGDLMNLMDCVGVEKPQQHVAVANYYKKINPGWKPEDWDEVLHFQKQTSAAAAAAAAKAKFGPKKSMSQLLAGSGGSLASGASFIPPSPSGGSNG